MYNDPLTGDNNVALRACLRGWIWRIISGLLLLLLLLLLNKKEMNKFMSIFIDILTVYIYW